MENNMVKLDEILEAVKYKEAAKKKEEKKTCILWILAIIGIVAAVAAVAYAVYRYLTPDYLEYCAEVCDDDVEVGDLVKEVPDTEAAAARTEDYGARGLGCRSRQITVFECLNSRWFGAVGTRFGSVQIKLYRVAHAGDDGMFLRERKNQKFRFSWGHPVL